jgi:hypothetical protein
MATSIKCLVVILKHIVMISRNSLTGRERPRIKRGDDIGHLVPVGFGHSERISLKLQENKHMSVVGEKGLQIAIDSDYG